MAGVIDEMRHNLEARLEELRPFVAEYEEIRRTLAALDEARNNRPEGRRVPLQERKAQVLDVVRAEPGISASGIGRRLGVTASRAVQIINRLEEEGAVERRDGG